MSIIKKSIVIGILIITAISSFILFYSKNLEETAKPCGISQLFAAKSPVERIPVEELTTPDLVLLGAREEAIRRVRYDASYLAIDYPGGDVPEDIGACTDVVIRAYRHAGIDLQVLIHEDMVANFQSYPQAYGLTSPDRNIDHRRVRNQMRFFERFGESLTLEVEDYVEEWQWGDIVYWRFPNGQLHAGIVSDKTNLRGIPLVIHNAWVTVEGDYLLKWDIIGHYRF